jgi:hypothetical protein
MMIALTAVAHVPLRHKVLIPERLFTDEALAHIDQDDIALRKLSMWRCPL